MMINQIRKMFEYLIGTKKISVIIVIVAGMVLLAAVVARADERSNESIPVSTPEPSPVPTPVNAPTPQPVLTPMPATIQRPTPPPTPSPSPSPTPTPRNINFPEIMILLSRTNVSGNSFLMPTEIDDVLMYELGKIMNTNIQVFVTQIYIIGREFLPSDILYSFNRFRASPEPGMREHSSLGISDAMMQYANTNRHAISVADYVELHVLAVLAALSTFTFIDCIYTSPLTSMALNRLWEGYKRIALHSNTPELERRIFLAIAASLSYVRIGRSYNDEVQSKRAGDIHGSRVIHIRMMDIAYGHCVNVAVAYANRANYLTELAAYEYLVLPSAQAILDDENLRIQNFISRHNMKD